MYGIYLSNKYAIFHFIMTYMSMKKCNPHGVKTCKNCGLPGGPDDFYWSTIKNRSGKKYQIKRALCKKCHNKKAVKDLLKRRAAFILIASRRTDKKHGFANNLTKDFIDSEIQKSCAYCGGTEILMTLDRIDNSTGHTVDNVVPCCLRCNIIRRDMPYLAWLEVSKAVRVAFEHGLFKDWVGAKVSKAHSAE